MKHVIFDIKSLRKNLITHSVSNLSWTAIASHLRTRSSDDIRHYWTSHMMNLLLPNQSQWTDDEDIELLSFIAA